MTDYVIFPEPDEYGEIDNSLPGGTPVRMWLGCGDCWRETWHAVTEFSDRIEYRCSECGAVTMQRRRAE